MAPDKLRDFAACYTVVGCSQDAASVVAFSSPEEPLTVNPGVSAKGIGEIAALAQSFITPFPHLQMAMDDVRVHVDGAEHPWTLTGTNTGPGGTGRQVPISGFERWQMGSEGLIASCQGQFAAADYQRQLEHGFREPRLNLPWRAVSPDGGMKDPQSMPRWSTANPMV